MAIILMKCIDLYAMEQTAAADVVPRVLNAECVDTSVFKAVEGLSNVTKHWIVPKRVEDGKMLLLLTNWLDGKMPPPKCICDECLQVTDIEGTYCSKKHACLSKTDPGCKVIRIPKRGVFCGIHSCATPMCPYEKLQPYAYCEQHVCTLCRLTDDGDANDVNDRVQDGICERHQCQVKGCKSMLLLPYLFCVDHICKQCMILEEKNAGRKNPNSDYCGIHECISLGCMKRCYEGMGDLCLDHACLSCLPIITAVVPESCYCRKHCCSHGDENDCLFP